MKILNFAHPFTKTQLAAIEALAGITISKIIELPSQIDPNRPIGPQIESILDSSGLTPQKWQTESLLINLPSLNYSTAALLAQLHGRMGYFPSVLRLRPHTGVAAPSFEVAEILNLQSMREQGRKKRS